MVLAHTFSTDKPGGPQIPNCTGITFEKTGEPKQPVEKPSEHGREPTPNLNVKPGQDSPQETNCAAKHSGHCAIPASQTIFLCVHANDRDTS